MRLFIAVPIDAGVRPAVSGLLARLKAAGADFKWVSPENLHLTLSFHGVSTHQQIPSFQNAMAEATAGREPFEIGLDGIDAFDSLENPRVVWIGVKRGFESLKSLADALLAALRRRGLLEAEEKAREFKAHLTLGRMKGRRNLPGLREAIESTPRGLDISLRVDRLVLYESRLGSLGSSYTELGEARLAGQG